MIVKHGHGGNRIVSTSAFSTRQASSAAPEKSQRSMPPPGSKSSGEWPKSQPWNVPKKRQPVKNALNHRKLLNFFFATTSQFSKRVREMMSPRDVVRSRIVHSRSRRSGPRKYV